MSRKRCKRKVWALLNPLEHAKAGACITSRADLDTLLIRELSSLDSFTTGSARVAEWSDMVNVNNLTQTLAGMGVGYEAMPDCHKAEAGLIEAASRYKNTGRMGLTGPSIQALRSVIWWHDIQRSSISRAEYEKAIKLTRDRLRSNSHNVIEIE